MLRNCCVNSSVTTVKMTDCVQGATAIRRTITLSPPPSIIMVCEELSARRNVRSLDGFSPIHRRRSYVTIFRAYYAQFFSVNDFCVFVES